MKKTWTVLPVLLVGLMLCGCSKMPEYHREETAAEVTTVPEETVPATIAPDGDPEDVTCKGSYTLDGDPEAVVATVEGSILTNERLQVYYWAAVAQYRQEDHAEAPDFDKPLDMQVCQIDASVNSWQQYFLRQALDNWHSAQTLTLLGYAQGLEAEEAYQPNLKNHEVYMTDMPAMQYHYSYNLESFHPNTLHQAYLDELPALIETLAQQRGCADGAELARKAFGTSEEELRSALEMYNWGYMYFTALSYTVENTPEEVADFLAAHPEDYTENGTCVDIRHLLMIPDDLEEVDDSPSWEKKNAEPVILETVEVADDGSVICSEAAWEAGLADAQLLLKKWQSDSKHSEATFAELARNNSDDPGSAINGGAYRNIRKGQLMDILDAWCFDASRQPGDTTILRSKYGYHIVYFCGSRDLAQAAAEKDLTAQKQAQRIADARAIYPAQVDYSAICLTEAEASVSYSDILYPDVAHERYPEAPLYLQQDYPKTDYGGYPIRTNGCGITTMSMLATYMTDEEYTPPEMCARYGHYSFSNGTDGRIFILEPPVLGFYCKEKTYEPKVAKQALEDGYVVVSLQHKGYWTRGGHYLLVEKMNEDGTVQVRDSNIYNYSKLDGHDIDRFKWSLIPANGSAFWIFEKKVTRIPACSRCGDPQGVVEQLMEEDYICEKCQPAMLRRETYLNICG